MVYTFQGCQRLQLWFGSPNMCALFLVILAVLCGLIDCLLSTTGKDRVYVIARWLNRLALLLELIGIALTYSRGAYLALILSLIILAWLLRQRRVLVWCSIFVLSLLLLPHTSTRVASIADIGDGSISHRIMLWEGVCAIIAEHPLSK
jgi:O-antigen ligase